MRMDPEHPRGPVWPRRPELMAGWLGERGRGDVAESTRWGAGWTRGLPAAGKTPARTHRAERRRSRGHRGLAQTGQSCRVAPARFPPACRPFCLMLIRLSLWEKFAELSGSQ